MLVLAGTYLSISRLPVLSDLWTTSYGQALIVKIAIVCVALSWGAMHHFFVAPRLERGEMPGALRRSLIGESAVAILVLARRRGARQREAAGREARRRPARRRRPRASAAYRATLPA